MSEKISEPFYKKNWTWIICIIIMCGIVGLSGVKKINITSSKDLTQTEFKKENMKKVTYDKFNKIKIGSSYEKVKAALGEGEKSRASKVEGIKTAVYTWNNGDGTNMSVIVQDDKVLGKTQSGLSTEKVYVNMAKYIKIKRGMDYNSVKDILGDGELIAVSEVNGSNKKVYSWVNFNGTNMNVKFENGKSIEKDQTGLS
ncbi:DUF3862 domain-containing protein [Clostridium botulinum]|nr:DUF3862 domain-containing protein [Clostridium botulinum]